ncbi:MAG: hypothetical protein FJY65_12180 [Calditrichaeota bacterium]|nr:hypothetical protein [Calditrichota bacterium]
MQISDSDKIKALLIEYETCQSAIHHQDSAAWRIGGLVFSLSVAGIYYLAGSERDLGWGIAPIAILSILILWFWYFIYRRWASFVEVASYRMQEIESDMGLFIRKNIYVDFLDGGQNGILPGAGISDDIQRRFDKIQKKVSPRFHRTSVHKYVRLIVGAISLLWLVLAITRLLCLR